MKLVRCLFTLAIAVCLASASKAEDKTLKLKDVPAPALAAAAKAYPKAKTQKWTMETENGKTVYEASMIEGTQKRDVQFAADGTLLEVEEEIAMTDLPAAVRSAVQAKYPGGVISKTEKITMGKEIQYEIGLKKAAKKELVVTSAGKIVSEE